MSDPESAGAGSRWKAIAAIVGSLAALIGAIATLLPVIVLQKPLPPNSSSGAGLTPGREEKQNPPPEPSPTLPGPGAVSDKEAQRAAVKRLALRLFEAFQDGDADTFTALVSDPFRFGEAVFSRTRAREMFLLSYAQGIGASPKPALVRGFVVSIDVQAVEDLREEATWGDTGKIVQENDLRPPDYLAKVVYKFPRENHTRQMLQMIRSVTDGYQVIGVIDL